GGLSQKTIRGAAHSRSGMGNVYAVRHQFSATQDERRRIAERFFAARETALLGQRNARAPHWLLETLEAVASRGTARSGRGLGLCRSRSVRRKIQRGIPGLLIGRGICGRPL